MKKVLIICFIFLTLVILFTGIYCLVKYKKVGEIVEISYHIGGGYAPIGDLGETITIGLSGKCIYLDNNGEKMCNVSSDQYEELERIINNNISVFYRKLRSNKSVLDGSSSTITIKTNDKTLSAGGYMITDWQYLKIKKKILEVVDYENIFNM